MLEDKASEQQRRMFFAICNDLGHDAETAKERAKAKYKLEHFADITKYELSTLIDRLLIQQNLRQAQNAV